MTGEEPEPVVAGPVLLDMPAPDAMRRVALARVTEASAAYDRLVGGDAAGLHDVRVALRRLRTWLRAFSAWSDTVVSERNQRRLRRVARATNDARDAEVAAEWVAAQTGVPARALRGVRSALDELAHERDGALHAARRVLAERLPALLDRLRDDFAPREPAVIVGAPSMADAVWPVLHKRATQLLDSVGEVSPADYRHTHRARITAKKLRYVLEPLYDPAEARAALASLVDVQDLLGGARDAHAMARRFVREVGERAARDARHEALAAIGVRRAIHGPSARSVRAGLIELAHRAHLEERRLFAAFRRRWGPRRARSVIGDIIAPFSRAVPRSR